MKQCCLVKIVNIYNGLINLLVGDVYFYPCLWEFDCKRIGGKKSKKEQPADFLISSLSAF
jgi:hypothetical protein